MLNKILMLIVLNLTYFFRTLRYRYVSDDIAQVNKKKSKNRLLTLWWQFKGISYSNPQVEHLLVILLHTANCILIYLVFGASNISFTAALWFAFLPSNNQVSIWLSGKGYGTATFLCIVMWWLKAWGFIPFLCTYFYGVSALLMPLIFIPYGYWYLSLLIPILFFINRKNISRVLNTRLAIITESQKRISLKKITLSIKTFGYYLTHCLFPRRLGMYHTFLASYGLSKDDDECWLKINDKYFWLGVISIIVVTSGIISDYSGVRFGLIWFCLGIGLWLNLKMINQPIGERFCYLPNVGLMLALAHLVNGNTILITAFSVYYATRLWLHMGAYKDDFKFTEYNLYDVNYPDQFTAWRMKGNSERNLGRPFKALESYYAGFLVRPRDLQINFLIAQLLAGIGFYNEAIEHLDKAEASQYYDIKSGVSTAIPLLKQLILEKKGGNGKVAVHK